MRRQLLKVLTLCLGLSATGVQLQTVKAQTPTDENHILVFENAGRLVAVSGNAKWAAGYISKSSGYLVNLETKTVIELLGGEVGSSEAWGVTNDGTVFGVANNLPAYWNNEGVFQGYLPVPGDPAAGDVCGVTPDGKYVGGNVYGSGFKGIPLRWERQEDGTYQYRKLTVFDKDYFGKKPSGFYVDAMSNDGTMFSGRMSDYEATYWPVIWKNIDQDEAPAYFGLENLVSEDGTYTGWDGWPQGFTKDNKYLFGQFEDHTGEGMGMVSHPFKMDIATNSVEFLQTQGNIMAMLLTNGDIITNVYSGTPYTNSFVDRANGDQYSVENFLKELYGVDIEETILDASGRIEKVSDDERTWVGFAGINGTGMGGFAYQLGNTKGDLVSVSEVQANAPVILSENGKIIVKGASANQVVVSDMSGKVLSTRIASQTTVIPAVKGQACIVKVVTDKASYIKKIMVM